MLQVMREKVMGWLGWVIIGLIIITFALFGLGSYLQDQTRVFAAKVNDVEISSRELQSAYQQQRFQLERMMGDSFDPGLIDEQKLKRQSLDMLINRSLLLQAAGSEGMAISDQLLAATIHGIPAFQQEGEFSDDLYQRFLAQRGETPAGFERDTRFGLAGEQLTNGLGRTAFITDYELEQAYRLQEQQRDLSYLIVSASAFEKDVETSDEQIREYYDRHGDEFIVPERVRLAFVRLTGEQLSETIVIDDADLKDYYQERKQSLQTEEQRKASHILVKINPDADETAVGEAQAKANELFARIEKGEAFDELAKAHSDDPGSAERGGDLGFFSKGSMVPEFEAAVFDMQEGEVSEPVRSQFGFHIIKLTGVRGSEISPLEQVRDELIAEMRQHRVDDLFYAQLEQLTDLAYEAPDSLDEVAATLGLKVQTSDWLTATGGPGIGQYRQLLAVAFSEDVLDAGNNSEPIEVGESDVIVVRVAEREAAHRAPLDEVRERIVEKIVEREASRAAVQEGESILEALGQGGSLDDFKDRPGVTFAKADAVKRSAKDHPGEILQAAFRLEKPAPGESLSDGVALSNGDYGVIRLTAVEDGDASAMDDAIRARLVTGYEEMRRSLTFSTLVENLRSRAEVVIPQDSE